MALKEAARRQGRKLLEAAKFMGAGLLVGLALAGVFALALERSAAKKPDRDQIHITEIDPEEGKSKEKEITIEYVDKKLEKLGELSTAQMTYTGLYTVTEGKIPFLTQKGFSMVYTAQVRAGIDVSKMEIQVTEKQVTVTLPPAEIQMLKVDPDSIQFYDEKHALFNWDKKTDVTAAISIAEEETQKQAGTDGLLQQAAQHGEYIVQGILTGSVGEREIVVKHR